MRKKHEAKFLKERKRLNEIVIKYSSNKMKKNYSFDAWIYQKNVLSKKIKELFGLIASLVLSCEDCITYHLMQCVVLSQFPISEGLLHCGVNYKKEGHTNEDITVSL